MDDEIAKLALRKYGITDERLEEILAAFTLAMGKDHGVASLFTLFDVIAIAAEALPMTTKEVVAMTFFIMNRGKFK